MEKSGKGIGGLVVKTTFFNIKKTLILMFFFTPKNQNSKNSLKRDLTR